MEPETSAPLPIGRSGRIDALPLARATGDHAILVRDAGEPQALLIADAPGGEERLVVTPLVDDVEVRIDGDALAIWVASSGPPPAPERVPLWASTLGLFLLLALVAFAIIGSATVFGWLLELVGG